jgi:hypothetical protein
MSLLRVLAVAVLWVSAVASAATRVSSDSSCPSSEAISLRLMGLLPAGGPENASAHVHVDAEAMSIEVTTPGEPSQQRTVPLSGDCAERAEMAALVVASWLDAMPATIVSAPGRPAEDRRGPSSANGSAVTDDGRGREPGGASRRALAGVGAFGMLDTQGIVPGLAVDVGMPALIGNLGLALHASVGLYRDLAVGAGTARYWRPTFVLRATAELLRGRWILRAVAGPALGVLAVSGSGYDRNSSDTTVMWGVDFGLVLARAWEKREAWISLGAMAWPQGRSIRSKPDGQASLPEWEARLALGFSWEIHGSER